MNSWRVIAATMVVAVPQHYRDVEEKWRASWLSNLLAGCRL